jgi:hypothetical protein
MDGQLVSELLDPTHSIVWECWGDVGMTWEGLPAPGTMSAMAWELTGNSGTDPANTFLGTTDGKPLVIQPVSRVGIGTTQPDTKLHVVGDVRVMNGNAGTGVGLDVEAGLNTALVATTRASASTAFIVNQWGGKRTYYGGT